jgi:SPP1 gp7 family putative phage head morphogenesis protein
MTPTRRNEPLKGGVLNPSAAIEQEFTWAILTLIRRMADETKKELTTLFFEAAHDAMDAKPIEGAIAGHTNISSQARIATNRLLDKYEAMFNKFAKRATKRMIDRTVKNSAVTLGMSLREISASVTLDPKQMTPKLLDIITASTTEAVGLIKLIPTNYLGKVQGAVMRSITSGNGMKDLVPFLEKQYQGNIRHARNVSMDQVRKSFNNINTARMDAIGVKTYEWVHAGGSKEPRPLHVAMNGNVYRLDEPPYIGDMYGEKVYGKPGDLPGCRCKMRPLVTFDTD